MAIAIAALVIWTALRAHRANWSARWAIALGLTLGALGLTRYNAYFAALPALALVLHGWWTGERRDWRAPLLVVAVALAVWGWWPVRNLVLYGEPTGVPTAYAQFVPADLTMARWFDLPNTMTNLLLKTPWIYDTWQGVWVSRAATGASPWVWTITAALLIILAPWPRRQIECNFDAPLLLLALALIAAIVLNAVASAHQALTHEYQAQGRHFLPLAPLVAGLVAAKVTRLPGLMRRLALAFGPLLMAAFLLAYVTGYFVPAAILFFV